MVPPTTYRESRQDDGESLVTSLEVGASPFIDNTKSRTHRADNNEDYHIRETLMGTKRKLKVIFMGMGCSGISFAYQLQRTMENVELVVYEKNNDVGGTWLENRYPGCACDIPSVCYQYSWQRKSDWSQYYSGAREIHQYFRDVADQHQLLKFTKLNHKIVNAMWLEKEGKWEITVMRNDDPSDTFNDHADFFLHGGGVLNKWKWPNIKGLDTFQGTILHTARWDEGLVLKGKKVLVIGAGSSGVQVVPRIIDAVDELYVVARSPSWITAGFAPTYAGPDGGNFWYSEKMKQRFKEDGNYYLSYCKAIESELNVRFRFLLNDTQDAEDAREYCTKEMRRKLAGKPELLKKLIPADFGVGCRRPTPGNGFLEALTLEKTTVFTCGLDEITPQGFTVRGQHHNVDIIVCATGFDTSFRPAFPIVVNGLNIQDEYDSGDVVGYLGLSAPEVPNYFVFVGPYGPLGHGSIIPMVEAYTNYIIQVLQKAQHEDIKRIQVKRSAAKAFTEHADLYLKRTAWSGPCSSWFKGGVSSRKPVCWPGSRVHYMTMLRNPRFEDFDISYLSKNQFNFLGNGFDVREFDGRDITWYYGLLNGEDKQPSSGPVPDY